MNEKYLIRYNKAENYVVTEFRNMKTLVVQSKKTDGTEITEQFEKFFRNYNI